MLYLFGGRTLLGIWSQKLPTYFFSPRLCLILRTIYSGMKNLKTYSQLFESVGELTPEQIEWLDSCTQGTWTLNPQTGLVDVKGDSDCSDQELTDFKGVRFGVVSGDFYCRDNQLTSLEGAPQEVGGDFSCNNNPVSEKTLRRIFSRMKKGKSYIQAVESLWSKIPLEDQALLYRPEFEWVEPEERRKLEAMRAYHGFKGMI